MLPPPCHPTVNYGSAILSWCSFSKQKDLENSIPPPSKQEGARLARTLIRLRPWFEILPIVLLAAALSCACSSGAFRRQPPSVSLCDLRDKPHLFSGRTVRAYGWVYTDLESFLLVRGQCGIALAYLEDKSSAADDAEQNRFDKLMLAAKKGTFNTSGDIFIVAEGSVKVATGPVGAHNPNKFQISRIICSMPLPETAGDKAHALSLCLQSGRAPL